MHKLNICASHTPCGWDIHESFLRWSLWPQNSSEPFPDELLKNLFCDRQRRSRIFFREFMVREVDGENFRVWLTVEETLTTPEKKNSNQPNLRDNNRRMSMVLCAATLNWSYKRDIELEFLEQETEMPPLEFNATLKNFAHVKIVNSMRHLSKAQRERERAQPMCVDNSAFMSLTVFAAPRPVGGSEKN